jgi:hypothetical protein
MPLFRPDDLSLFLCTFIQPQRLLLREPDLCPELRPALVSLQPPLPLPQQPSHPRLFPASYRLQLRPQQRRSLRLMLRDDPRRPSRPLERRKRRLQSKPNAMCWGTLDNGSSVAWLSYDSLVGTTDLQARCRPELIGHVRDVPGSNLIRMGSAATDRLAG